MSNGKHGMNRREFLRSTAVTATAAASGGLAGRALGAQDQQVEWRNKHDGMVYRRLGRTNYMASRIVSGNGGSPPLWEAMLDLGLNYFDTAHCYGNGQNEIEFSEVVSKHRDRLWITSKASDIAGFRRVDPRVKQGDPNAGKIAAQLYTEKLDESLKRLKTDHMDAYFMHGISIPWFFDLEEPWAAYEKAHQAGKVKHFGFSSHANVQKVLEAAVVADEKGPWKIDLVMPACNPALYHTLKPTFAKLKARDIGVIAMKTTAQIRQSAPELNEGMAKLKGLELNQQERAYAYMLHATENVDAVISKMGNFKEMETNLKLPSLKLAGTLRRALIAQVQAETRGACHHCGDCVAACPEQIEVLDMLRYHSYFHNYGERELARALYGELGNGMASVCTHCGQCRLACPADIDLDAVLSDVEARLA